MPGESLPLWGSPPQPGLGTTCSHHAGRAGSTETGTASGQPSYLLLEGRRRPATPNLCGLTAFPGERFPREGSARFLPSSVPSSGLLLPEPRVPRGLLLTGQ